MKLPVFESARARYLLSFCFFISGLAGLIYQIVWMRMLVRVFGVSVEATSVTVAVFLAGLALGAYAAGRVSQNIEKPLLAYAGLEWAVAAFALISSLVLMRLPVLLVVIEGFVGGNIGVERILLSAAVLLIPTFLMGATLPVGCLFLQRERHFSGSGIGLLYGINTLGASLGVFFCGFIGMALFGEMRCVLLAVMFNILAGGLALCWHFGSGIQKGAMIPFLREDDKKDEVISIAISEKIKFWGSRARVILVIAAISGFCSLAYEMVWARFLTLILGTSTYAFSLVLGTYLTAMALGSLLSQKLEARFKDRKRLLGALQVLLGLMSLGCLILFKFIAMRLNAIDYLYSPLTRWQDMGRFAFFAMLCLGPQAILMGLIFPMIVRVDGDLTGSAEPLGVGRVYASNTLGSIAGSILTIFLGIFWLGTAGCFILAATLNILIGVWFWASSDPPVGLRQSRIFGPVWISCVMGAAIFGIASMIIKDPFLSIIQKRAQMLGAQVVFHEEEPAATISGLGHPRLGKLLLINGIVVSGMGPAGADMSQLAALLHSNPKDALLVGFGVGKAFYTLLEHGLRVDVAELVAGVPRHFGDFFPEKVSSLRNPNAQVIINDARNHLLRASKRYDIVIVDCSPPIFAAGAVNLYTKEFVELAQSRLSADGILMIWVPLPCFVDDFWMIARNMTEVFPFYDSFAAPRLSGIMLVGSNQKIDPGHEELVRRFKERNWPRLGYAMPDRLLERVRPMNPQKLKEIALRRPQLTDDRPHLEFPLGKFLRGETMKFDHGFLGES